MTTSLRARARRRCRGPVYHYSPLQDIQAVAVVRAKGQRSGLAVLIILGKQFCNPRLPASLAQRGIERLLGCAGKMEKLV
jgi:hypothetical protein